MAVIVNLLTYIFTLGYSVPASSTPYYNQLGFWGNPIYSIQSTPVGRALSCSTSASFSVLPKAGNAVIVYIAAYGLSSSSIGAGAVTDNQGNTYSQAVTVTGGDHGSVAIHYNTNIGNPSGTFTVSVAATCSGLFKSIDIIAVEYSGIAKTNAVDKTSTGTSGGTTACTTGATPTTTSGSELLSAVSQIGGCANTQPSGWNVRYNETNSTYSCLSAIDKKSGSIDTQSATWSHTSQSCEAAIATFKAGP